jgi:hypothetical protein
VHGSAAAYERQADVDVVFNATTHVAEAPSQVHSTGSLASEHESILVRHQDRASLVSSVQWSGVVSRLYVLNQVFRL